MNGVLSDFEAAYKRLNLAQKEAVDAIEGPVMVIAGPGTGKTQILTLRIANIIRTTDTEPENILALTYSEAGAVAMRKRLASLIGSAAYSVAISTFHGFCNEIIRNNPESFSRVMGSESITEIEQIKIVKSLIEKNSLKELRPYGSEFFYLRDILSAINSLKREGISTAAFREIAEEERKQYDEIGDLEHDKGPHKGKVKGKYIDLLKKIGKHLDLALLYEKYEESLEEAKLYDYDDMIMEVIRALEKNEELLLILQEKYQYVLIDEHQDTNRAQNKVVEKLMDFHDNPNVFVVGDDKQAIYRFQGASLENFYHFKNLYPEAKLIALEENYRSTQTILDSASNLLEGPKPLMARAGYDETKILLRSFSSEDVESHYLAKDVSDKIKNGINPSEIAILYRNNADAFPIAEALRKAGVPASIESDENVLGDEDVRKIFLILKAIDGYGDDKAFIEAAHIDFLEIDPFDLYRCIRLAETKKAPPMRVFKSSEVLASLEIASAEKITAFIQNLERWVRMGRVSRLDRLFETIIRDSGALASIMKNPDSLVRLEKINGLFREIKTFAERNRRAGIKELVEHLSLLEEEGVLIKKTNIAIAAGSVRLMTAHRSKGQEFDSVYIVRAIDGKWGNKRRTERLPLPRRIFSIEGNEFKDEDDENDERRLFFVAMTRARKEVSISYARQNREGKEQLPSRFIGEIKSDFIEERDSSEFENDANRIPSSFLPVVSTEKKINDPKIIIDTFNQKGLSATDLNNYLKCPWRYFYTGLFRIPEAQNKYQSYGTAVHGSLKDFFEALKERDPGKDFLIEKFEYLIKKEPLKERDLKDLTEKGKKALSGYFDFYSDHWMTNTISEFSVRGVELAPGVFIKGRIDKIELGSTLEANVVDYKTGKPKTRGQIEGSTKDSSGDIKRQLVFYKLLLDNYSNRKYKMATGSVDFVEPDEKGRYHREVFDISDNDANGLKDLIIAVTQEIKDLSFWDKRCDDKECPYCAIRNMMD
ncbi:MAG: ATP-dependent DNA helicase [Candidatus Colwellbacteria bacterium]|nr:ATP-dependent DNA helicase [Candidatus Colwellbacteria bacterium]